jgi:hypothetical protein
LRHSGKEVPDISEEIGQGVKRNGGEKGKRFEWLRTYTTDISALTS